MDLFKVLVALDLGNLVLECNPPTFRTDKFSRVHQGYTVVPILGDELYHRDLDGSWWISAQPLRLRVQGVRALSLETHPPPVFLWT